jgi:hypothetical protein
MEKNLLWILWAASSSYELPALPSPSPHVGSPAKVFTATKTKMMCNIELIFVLKNFSKNLFLRKIIFENKFCNLTKLVKIFATLYACFVIFSLCALLL